MSISGEFEKGPVISVVYKLGPGVAEGHPVHIGGQFNFGMLPGEPKELPPADAHALVKMVPYVDYVNEADRPKPLKKDAPVTEAPPPKKETKSRRCPEC